MRWFTLVTAVIVTLSMVFYHAPASAQTPLERVIEAAKKEGKITTYADYAYEEAKDIQAAFNKRYPFIKFEHVSLGAAMSWLAC